MKHKKGIQSKLLFSFIIFSALIVLILWLLEVVFLDDIYRNIKSSSIRPLTESMDKMSDEYLKSLSSKSASKIGLCISIYDEDFQPIVQEHTEPQCVVHNISKSAVINLYQFTEQMDGNFESHLPAQDLMKILNRNEYSQLFPSFSSKFFPVQEPDFSFFENYDCVLYSQITENDLGQMRYVLISSILLPVDATVQTIRFELNLVIGILIFMSLVMTYILSRTISKPISDLNKASKTLPEGKFVGEGIGGYREVEELKETLAKSAETISQIDKLQKELIANVSHDLRTPLTLITGYSEAMRDIPGENTPENLQVIIDESRHLSELVTDLLDLSKLEAGTDMLHLESVELVSFTKEILCRYEKLIFTKGYKIIFENSKELFFVFADPIRLNQIIYNLVNNAIHYCGDDKTVIVRLYQRGSSVCMEIEDHGEGIEENEIDHIWDRYYRGKDEHRPQTVGSGLGLSIVKKLLNMHGAVFGVKSKAGEGSTFWFSLPLNCDF